MTDEFAGHDGTGPTSGDGSADGTADGAAGSAPNGTDGPHGSDSAGSGPGSGGAGSLGDEARTLFGAVQEWAQRAMPAPPSGHGGPECQWCPLCQFASILRGEHPEVADRVAEAGSALVGAFRALVETAVAKATPAPGSSPGSAPVSETGPSKPRPTPRVQRIHLDDPADGS